MIFKICFYFKKLTRRIVYDDLLRRGEGLLKDGSETGLASSNDGREKTTRELEHLRLTELQ